MADVTITYKGNEIATMSATGAKTLLTEAKYCEDDITIDYVKPSAPAPNLQAKSNISPTLSSQTVTADAGYDGLSSVQINAMPSGSATTPATTITANPSISVNLFGEITASVSKSQKVTPTVSPGYVSSGTYGTVTVSGSSTQQLPVKAAATYTPTTTSQVISAGQYLTGAQSILGDANLLAENIKDGVDIFGITGTYTGGGGGGSGPYVVGIVPQSYFSVSNALNQAGATVTVYFTGTTNIPLPPMSQLVVADVNQTPLIVLKGGGVLITGETYTFTMPSESVVITYSGGM